MDVHDTGWKRWLMGVAVAAVLSSTALAAPPAQTCWDKARTQDDLNRCASTETAAAEQQLQRVYQQILQKYADDPGFIGKLKAAQAAWLKFRDAQLSATFPPAREAGHGSAVPMCFSNAKTRLTEERIRQLQRWLDGIDEGDLCGGSIKLKRELKMPSRTARTPLSRPPKRRK